jgi:hypothetical protein
MDRQSVRVSTALLTPESTARITSVSRQPGSAISSAERSIPPGPATDLPRPAAISTGRAPGVIAAATTSRS